MNIGRKYKTATYNTTPSLTDQSQARETDVNVIVKRYAVTGTVPGNAQSANAMYGDFIGLPRDLRGFIETARDINKHKANLPPELQTLSFEELATLDWASLAAKLKPTTPQPNEVTPNASVPSPGQPT